MCLNIVFLGYYGTVALFEFVKAVLTILFLLQLRKVVWSESAQKLESFENLMVLLDDTAESHIKTMRVIKNGETKVTMLELLPSGKVKITTSKVNLFSFIKSEKTHDVRRVCVGLNMHLASIYSLIFATPLPKSTSNSSHRNLEYQAADAWNKVPAE